MEQAGPKSTVDVTETENALWLGVHELAVGAAAGLLGTVAMAPFLAAAWVLGAVEPSAFAGLATILGLGESFAIGGAIFVAGGVVTLPLLFVSLAVFLPGRNLAEKGAVFAAIVWTGFAVAFFTAQSGTTLAVFLALTLLAHVAYGGVLGGLYARYADVPEYEV
jgi:cytochrome c oxidase subunit 1